MKANAAAIACVLGCLTAATQSTAAPSKGPATPGEKLFREGREAMDRKELATACAKFAESYALEHVVTSLLNEADCEEKRGRLATSLRLWRDGRAKADDASTTSFVDDRVRALEPRVPKLTLRFGPGATAEARLTLDGASAKTEGSLEVDPGDHLVEARDRGGRIESRRVTLEEGKSLGVTMLESAGVADAAPGAAAKESAPASRGGRLRTAGFVVGSIGAAGLLTFGVTGVMVLADHASCPKFRCTADKRPGELLGINAAALGVGVLGVGAAIPLLVVGYKQKGEQSPAVTFAPSLGGATVRGTF